VDKVTLEKVFSKYFGFPMIPQTVPRLSSSFGACTIDQIVTDVSNGLGSTDSVSQVDHVGNNTHFLLTSLRLTEPRTLRYY
jgi:hypothetical protein